MREEYVFPKKPREDSTLSPTGIFTQHGRCFEFWKKLKECEQTAEIPRLDCPVYFEDYVECLHHKKEKARIIKVIRAYEEKVKSLGQQSALQEAPRN